MGYILLFKTFVDKIHAIHRWSTDLEDCDNILRIESLNEVVEMTISALSEQGFQIEELK